MPNLELKPITITDQIYTDLHELLNGVISIVAQLYQRGNIGLSLIHISEPTRLDARSRMPSSA